MTMMMLKSLEKLKTIIQKQTFLLFGMERVHTMYFRSIKNGWGRGYSSAAQHLSDKCEVVSSIPGIKEKRKLIFSTESCSDFLKHCKVNTS